MLWKINKTDKWVKEGHGEWGFVEYLLLRRGRHSRSKGILLMKAFKILTDNLSENRYGLEQRTLFLVKKKKKSFNPKIHSIYPLMCHSFGVLMGLILYLGLWGKPWGGEGGPCRSLWEWVSWSISSPSLQRWVQWSKLYQASLTGTFSCWMEEKFLFLLVM